MYHHTLNSENTVLVITGPTASGKSSLAHELARRMQGEIISADSRQIYRQLDIGTAKPSREMQEEIPYHLLDICDIGQEFTAWDFIQQAQSCIQDIRSRGHQPIIVGGTTLYIQGLLQGFTNLPAKDPAIRARLEEEIRTKGPEPLYKRLEQLDPMQAATLDPSKTQRLIRSLEIIELSGKTVTELMQQQEKEKPGFNMHPVALSLPRGILYKRINERTDAMIEQGLIEEAKNLHEQFGQRIREGNRINALETVGYSELFDYFNGAVSLDEAIALIKQHTRNYAKRQLTFFRNKLDLFWMPPPDTN